jgi:hypothetical protein
VFFAGGLCLVLALTSPGRRSYLAGALALMPYGLAIPFYPGRGEIIILGGLAVVLAGLVAPAIMAWQLRAQGREHERATH